MGAAAITKGCINRPVTVLVSLIALVIFALLSVTSIPLKLMPEMNYPMIMVTVPLPGVNPEEQDELIVDKLEESLSTVTGARRTLTEASMDTSVVGVQFDYGTDMAKAYDDVKKKVDLVKHDFPKDAEEPIITEMEMNASNDMSISITPATDGVDVLNEVETNIEPEFKKLSTVAEVNTSGGIQRYISIKLIPEYCAQYGLTVSSVADAIKGVNFNIPSGRVSNGTQTLNLSAKSEYKTVPELEQVPITINGQIIHLSDVAEVYYAVNEKTTRSRYNGKSGVNIDLKRKQSASPVTLSNQVKKILPTLQEENPRLVIDIVNDSADTILKSLSEVGKTLIMGILLSMFVLFIFFGDLKASLIVGSSMPISLLATVICMNAMGFSLNVVTMSALVIGIGMMVDNSIVVLEMAFRKRDEGFTFADAAYEGTRVVLGSIIGSTITTVVVYAPLATMKGLAGQMFGEMGYTIIFAIVSSLFSAMTIIPYFFSRYEPVEKKEILTNKVLENISFVYGKLLTKVVKKKKTVLFVSILLFAFTIFLATKVGVELMAATDQGVVTVNMTFRENISLDEMDKTVKRMEEYVISQPEIDKYTANLDETNSSATVTAFRIKDLEVPSQEIADRFNLELRNFSNDCEIKASTPSMMGSMSSGVTQDIAIESMDIDDVKTASEMITDALAQIDGVLYVNNEMKAAGTKAEVVIDPVQAKARGFSPEDLASQVYKNISGTKAMDSDINGKRYKVTVEYPKNRYDTLSDIESMTFTSPTGVLVPITEVAEVKFASSVASIYRQNSYYYVTITATMTADTVDEVSKKVVETAHNVELPPTVRFAKNPMEEMQNEELFAILRAILIAVFLVFMVMAIQFESMVYSLLIMLCIPFSLVGSISLLYVTGVKISMTSAMGVLMLAGIVVNNGIIYVDTANQFRQSGTPLNTAIIDAGKSRLRPILMTTLTTILSMIPVSLGLSENAKTMQGMGLVIIGGLFASTILTLLMLPTFYLMVQKLRKKTKKGRKKRFFGMVKEKEMNISDRFELDPHVDDLK